MAEIVKYGIFSDIHSNLEALCAVLDDMQRQGVTHRVCLGDTVGYNANPQECLTLVRKLHCPVVKGNHDAVASNTASLHDFNELARAGIAYSREKLTAEERAYLAQLPLSQQIDSFTVVHASLQDPDAWYYISSAWEAEGSFVHQRTQVCFYGHTHVPKVFVQDTRIRELPRAEHFTVNQGSRYLVNVGAVGQPRDGDWRASYAIFEPDGGHIEFRRVTYDVELTKQKITQAGLPELLALRLGLGA